jgi:hypothetical protein
MSDLDSGLIHYWPMDEAGTVTRVDTVGSWDLLNSGTITNATGKKNNGVKSSESGSDILKSTLTFPAAFTIAGWFKVSASDECQGFRVIDATAISQIWFEPEDTWDQVRCGATKNYFGGASYAFIGSITVTDWFFMAVRTDGQYVRYRANATDSSDLNMGTSWTPNFHSLQVAKAQTGDDAYADELGMWDRELTSDELDLLYNNGAGKFARGGSFAPNSSASFGFIA